MALGSTTSQLLLGRGFSSKGIGEKSEAMASSQFLSTDW